MARQMHLYQGTGNAARSYATPQSEPSMDHQSSITAFTIRVCLLACAAFCLLPASHAQTPQISGRYQCVQVKSLDKVAPCTAAPLILKNDGHFELRGWEGNYLVNGQWVVLSDSMLKARAKIEPGHKISLRYYGKNGLVEMIFERRVAELGKTALS
jgi:hypothetical protein